MLTFDPRPDDTSDPGEAPGAAARLTTGFAQAVRPVASATTITTDTVGLVAGETTVRVADGTLPAYAARPDGEGPFPTVLVVQEIFGVHEHIKDLCRRFAKRGYLAVATELYARQGDVSKLSEIDQIREVVSRVPDAQVMADLDATVDWAWSTGKADVARLGITGFCWGGRIVWLYAAHSSALKAGIAWYGRLVGEPSQNQPRHPVDIAAEIGCPVLGLYGGADQGIPVETVEQMKAALAKAGKTFEIIVYPDTPHAFGADYRPSYREEPAKDGWQRCLAWLAANGVA